MSVPTKDRSCDGCTLCCVVFNIEALSKPAYVSCRHLSCKGCAIHGQKRPDDCETFLCAYRIGVQERHPKEVGFLVNLLDGVVRIMRAPSGVDEAYLIETLRFWLDDVRCAVEVSSPTSQTLYVPGSNVVALGCHFAASPMAPPGYVLTPEDAARFGEELDRVHVAVANRFADVLVAFLRGKGVKKLDSVTTALAAQGNQVAMLAVVNDAVGKRRV